MLSGSQGCAQTLTCPRLNSASTSKPGGSQGLSCRAATCETWLLQSKFIKISVQAQFLGHTGPFPGLRSRVRPVAEIFRQDKVCWTASAGGPGPRLRHRLPPSARTRWSPQRMPAALMSGVARLNCQHSPGYFILLLKLNIYRWVSFAFRKTAHSPQRRASGRTCLLSTGPPLGLYSPPQNTFCLRPAS